jgi:hypothetical protein
VNRENESVDIDGPILHVLMNELHCNTASSPELAMPLSLLKILARQNGTYTGVVFDITVCYCLN